MATWMVTGASSGLGRALAETVLEQGERCAVTVRDGSAAGDLKARYGDRVWVGVADVTNAAALTRAVDEAFDVFGEVDVAVSNAGYGLFAAAEEASEAQIERQIATNLTGSIRFARLVLPYFRKQGRGHFMQISSMGGQVAFPLLSVYHATKWGIEGFCESLAQEVAAFGVNVTIVEPGGAKTNWAGASGEFADAMVEYESTLVGKMRKALKAHGGNAAIGDPKKMALAMIMCAQQSSPPLRLTLGSDAFNAIQARVAARLEALEDQKAIALSTDASV